jgi:hypothetical protein
MCCRKFCGTGKEEQQNFRKRINRFSDECQLKIYLFKDVLYKILRNLKGGTAEFSEAHK